MIKNVLVNRRFYETTIHNFEKRNAASKSKKLSLLSLNAALVHIHKKGYI